MPCGDTPSVIAAHIPALIKRVIRRVPTRSHLRGSAWTLGVGPGSLARCRIRAEASRNTPLWALLLSSLGASGPGPARRSLPHLLQTILANQLRTAH